MSPPGCPLFPATGAQAKLLRGPFPDPGPHHRQGHSLAIREAIEGLADRAVLLVHATAAKLEGWVAL